MLDLTLRGKTVDLNYFNSDVLYDSIEESRLGFEDNRDGKGGLSNPKVFFIKNELNGRTGFTTSSHRTKIVVVCPY